VLVTLIISLEADPGVRYRPGAAWPERTPGCRRAAGGRGALQRTSQNLEVKPRSRIRLRTILGWPDFRRNRWSGDAAQLLERGPRAAGEVG